jgi:hypothetical protein
MYCVAAAAMSTGGCKSRWFNNIYKKVPKETGTLGLPGARAGHVPMGQPARLNEECPFQVSRKRN